MANSQTSAKAILKQINIYTRRHPFVLGSTESFTTSQRRAFVRDVYDYSRSLGLNKKDARQQTIKAREMCGEDDYDTDETALENEIDDSQEILTRLQGPSVSQSKETLSFESTANAPQTTKQVESQRPVPSSQSLVNLQKRKREPSDIELDSRTAQLLKGTGFDGVSTLPTQRKQRNTQATNTSKDIAGSKGPKAEKAVVSSSIRKIGASDQRRGPEVQKNSVQNGERGMRDVTSSSEVKSKSSENRKGKANVTKSPTNNIPEVNSSSVKPPAKSSQIFPPPEVVTFSDDDDIAPEIQMRRPKA